MMRARVVLLLLGGVVGCTFERRSPDFACTSECTGGRACVDGFCVDLNGADAPPRDGAADADPNGPDGADGALPDGTADADLPDAFQCPSGCSSCQGAVCVIDCNADSSCAALVVCPPGVDCRVECHGQGSCAGGVDCSAAASCDLECTMPNSCGGRLTCGAGACRVECPGMNSCTGGIDCDGSCKCDVLCNGSGSCMPLEADCPDFHNNCDTGAGCQGVSGQCNHC